MPYFQAFQPVSVTVTFFMNSITFVMNHLFSYFDISICHSSNRTLSYRLFLSHGSNHGYILGGDCTIHCATPTFVENLLLSGSIAAFRERDVFRKIDISLQPDNTLKSAAYLWFPEQIYYIDTDIKCQFIRTNC